MINNAKTKKGLPVYGDGMNVRDWLYVEDHCKAIDMVAVSYTHLDVYKRQVLLRPLRGVMVYYDHRQKQCGDIGCIR